MTERPRAGIVYNPVKVDVEDTQRLVGEAERAAGWNPSLWIATTETEPGGQATREAMAAGVNVVIAAGGDGTIRAVAEALHGGSTPLALLPAGTGNLLARNLGFSLGNPQRALEVAFSGDSRDIDIGMVRARRPDGSEDDHAFLVMTGIGLDAQMAAHTNPRLKRRFGWIAYVHPIARAIRGRARARARYTIDGSAEKRVTVNTLLVGNCGTLTANIQLLPDASIDDGLLDIVALRPSGFVGWLQITIKVIWENGVLHRSAFGRKIIAMQKPVRALRYLRGRSFTLALDRPEEFELDGDAFGEVIGFSCRIAPKSLIVKVPAEGT